MPSDLDDRLTAGFGPEVILLQGGEPSHFNQPMTPEWATAWFQRMVTDENPWAWMIEYHVPIDRKVTYAIALNSSDC